MGNSSRLIYVSPDRRGYVSSPKQESQRETVAINDRGHYVCENFNNERKKSSSTSS